MAIVIHSRLIQRDSNVACLGPGCRVGYGILRHFPKIDNSCWQFCKKFPSAFCLPANKYCSIACVFGANIIIPFANYAWFRNWGTSSDDTMPFGDGVLFNAWVANSPQIILSFCYLSVNNICTFLASAEEWNNLADTRKGLRVSRPIGQQRSTYFLQLPYKWAVPLITASSVLYWLLSQSFFFVQVSTFAHREMVTSKSKAACGFSSLSLLIFFIVALLLLCGIGWVASRPVQQKMPIAASCSLVISAACHSSQNRTDTQLMKVKWGVVEQKDSDGVGHCCLSAGFVKKPEVGTIYH